MRSVASIAMVLVATYCWCQHDNELYVNGATLHITSGAEIHVNGDVHFAGGVLNLNGLLRTQGNSYSNASFQQRGSGTYRIQNSTVNTGESQFLSGSFAVRGGQSAIGSDDGSFYDLEIDNDQGVVYLVGSGNVADVRNGVDFAFGAVTSRIITHDIGLGIPANGADYDAVFGMMNTSSGLGSFTNNSISLFGNLSTVDAGFVQGKLRRAINTAGGVYGFVLGLEPAAASEPRGVQYAHIDFEANTYDVVTGYFQQGLDNSAVDLEECGIDFTSFQGGAHGQWVFEDIGSGSGTYGMALWPQGTLTSESVWTITKDNALSGTPCDHGPSFVGISRGGYSGFSSFGVVGGASSALPVVLRSFEVACDDKATVRWSTASEIDNDYFELEGSMDGQDFYGLERVRGAGNSSEPRDYQVQVDMSLHRYFRLTQVDYNGEKTTFGIVASDCPQQPSQVLVYPNPHVGQVMISGWNPTKQAQATVVDVQGRLVRQMEITEMPFAVDLSGLKQDVYFLVLSEGDKKYTHRLIRDD